jgi:integrase
MAKAKAKQKTKGANGSGYMWTNEAGYLFAVISWVHNGKRQRKFRRAITGSKTEARQHIKDMQAEFLQGGAAAIDGAKLTLGELGEYHKRENLREVRFNQKGIRTEGVHSWKDGRRTVDRLVAYFGKDKLVRSLTLGNVRSFKRDYLAATPVTRYKHRDKKTGKDIWTTKVLIDPKTGKPREKAVATAHRAIAMLRRMLNVAVEEGWLAVNPIAGRKALINPAEENKRDFIATQFEETKLLDQCDDHPYRRHLRPYLIVGFDHGCRSAELRRMLVSDVNFETGTFWVHSFKGKQRKDREYVMTPNSRAALLEACADKTPSDHVFTYGKAKRPLKYAPRRSFMTAKRLAKWWSNDQVDLSHFRGHDMRHTHITRLIKSGMSVDEACKLAGHEQPSTTWRYLNPDNESRQRAAAIIANYSETNVIQLPKRAKQTKQAQPATQRKKSA